MIRYIFIIDKLNKLDTLIKSINEETGYKISDYISLEDLEKLQDCSSIGFIYHSSNIFPFYDKIENTAQNYFQNISSDFWNKIKNLNCVVDLITCNLNQEYQISSINTVSKEYGIQFRYSLDETGNYNNWILEKSTDVSENNTDIKELYFNSEINNWDVLLVNPSISSYSVNTDNVVTLTVNGGNTAYYQAVIEIERVSDNATLPDITINNYYTGIFNLTIANLALGTNYYIYVTLHAYNGSTYYTQTINIWTYTNSSLTFNSFYRENSREYVKYQINFDITSSNFICSSYGLCYSSTNKTPEKNVSNTVVTKPEENFNTSTTYFVSGEITLGTMYYVRFFYIINNTTYYSPVYVLPTSLKPTVNYVDSKWIASVSINTTELVNYGVCWNNQTGPIISNPSHIMGTNVSGALTSSYEIPYLANYKTYYIKTYITYGATTYYSLDETIFTTKPVIETILPTFKTNSTALSGLTVTVSQTVTFETGVCWSIYPNPTILFSKKSNGNSTINTTSTVSGAYNNIEMNLLSDATYYVRGYVIINSNAYYGNQKTYDHVTANLKFQSLSIDYETELIYATYACNLNITNTPKTVSSCGICYSTTNKLPTVLDTKVDYVNNVGNNNVTFTNQNPINISGVVDIGYLYYVRFFYIINGITCYSNVSLLPTIPSPVCNETYTRSVDITLDIPVINNSSSDNELFEYGLCWSTQPYSLTNDFYVKIGSKVSQAISNIYRLKSLLPLTTYYIGTYIKINSVFFYSFYTTTFTTLADTDIDTVFNNPSNIFNNKSYNETIGNVKLNLSGSNLSNLNLDKYYLGGVNLTDVEFDNITTSDILGQPILSNEYTNNYGLILGPNIKIVNPVITEDKKDIFSNINLSNSTISGATIHPDCLVSTAEYFNTTFTTTNVINKTINDRTSFIGNRIITSNSSTPVSLSINQLNSITALNIKLPYNINTTRTGLISSLISVQPTFVKTNYGLFINDTFLLQDGTDLSDTDLSMFSSILFHDTSFKNIGSNSNTKLPKNVMIVNKYILGPKVIIKDADFNNVVSELNIDLSGVICSGIKNYNNIIFSGNYRIINGYIIGPNTSFKDVCFKQSDFSGLKLINVVFDNCSFADCFGKLAMAFDVKFINCEYQIIGGYIIGPYISFENTDFESKHYTISVNLRNVSSNNIQNYENVIFKDNKYEIINGCIFGENVIVKNIDFTSSVIGALDYTVNVNLYGIISSNIKGNLNFNDDQYFLLEGFIIGPKVNFETIKISTDNSKTILINLLNTINTNVIGSDWTEIDKLHIINIINKYDSNSTLSLFSNSTNVNINDNSNIEISAETFEGQNKAVKYCPNFDQNSTLKIIINDNEYIIISKLFLQNKKQKTYDIFYKFRKFNKITNFFIETVSLFYNKGTILNIEQYKIILE